MKLLIVKIFDEIHQEVSCNRKADYSQFLLSLSNYFSRSLLDDKKGFYIELEHIKSPYPDIHNLLCQLEELKK